MSVVKGNRREVGLNRRLRIKFGGGIVTNLENFREGQLEVQVGREIGWKLACLECKLVRVINNISLMLESLTLSASSVNWTVNEKLLVKSDIQENQLGISYVS